MQLPSWLEEEPEHLRGLLIELHWVRRRGMRGLATSAPIHELVRLASIWCPRASPLSQRELTTALLDTVLLPRLEPEQDQKAIPIYFGIARETWTSTERKRREKTALIVFHQGFSTFCKPTGGCERPFLVRIATVLDELRKTTPKAGTYRSYSTPYVARPQYHEAFDALVAKGCKLIVLDGDPGNGKTRLADELIAMQMRQHDTRIYLTANNMKVLMAQISGVLEQYAGRKLKGHPLNDDEITRAFAAFLCSQDAPTYLVIDNIKDRELLERLVPPGARSTIVVTSQENILPSGRGEPLSVNSMEAEEALQFAAFLLPNVTRDDLEKLTETLGNKPLAIDHACTGLLSDGYMTVQEFRAAFARNAAIVMKQAKNPVDESLPFIYQQIMSRIRQDDAKNGTNALTLLELVAFVAPEAIPQDLLRRALIAASPPKAISLAPVEFQSAQRELQRLHLIQLTDDGFTVHQFTQALLRDLLHNKAVEWCAVLHRVLADEFANLEPGDALGEGVISLLPHVSKVLLGLSAIDPSRQIDESIERIIGILERGLRQIGNTSDRAKFLQGYFAGRSTMVDQVAPSSGTNEGAVDIFLEDAYHGGIITRSSFVHAVFQILEQEYGTPDAIDIDSYAGVKLIEATMLDYQYEPVDALLEKHLAVPHKKGKKGAAWRADVLRLVGDSQAIQAEWENALAIYRRALQVYKINPEDLNCLRGKQATLLSIANTAIEMCDLPLARDHAISAARLIADNESVFVDYPTYARMLRIVARTMTVESLAAAVLDIQDVSQLRNHCDEAFRQAFNNHKGVALGRHMLGINYDWGCYRLLYKEVMEVQYLFQENAAEARELDDLDTALMYHLGLIKIGVIKGSATLRDIGRCLRIGSQFLDDCKMSNRHADAVGTAYVVAVICNAPVHVVDALRESAHGVYEAIDKTSKFELIDTVGSEVFNPLTLFIP